MRELVAELAGPYHWSDKRERWFERAAQVGGVSFRTIRSIFYGQITDENHKAILLIRQAIRRRNEKAANDRIARRVEDTANLLSIINPEAFGDQISELWSVAGEIRGQSDV